MNPVTIHQIFYRENQIPWLDPLFVPYDNQGVSDPFLEFGVIRKLNKRYLAVDDCRYWGALSWKFKKKTGLDGQDLLDFINSHDQVDAFYCNPSPEAEGLFHNLWMHGESTHPRFLSLAAEVLKNANLDVELLNHMHPSYAFASANYIIATPAFWEKYIAFVDGVMDAAMKDVSLRERLLSKDADEKKVHAGACYIPFVVERLFSLFLTLPNSTGFKYMKYPVPAPEKKLGLHPKKLREMKDAACHTRSQWLAGCWLSYRSLYLKRTENSRMERIHMPAITTPDFRFSSMYGHLSAN